MSETLWRCHHRFLSDTLPPSYDLFISDTFPSSYDRLISDPLPPSYRRFLSDTLRPPYDRCVNMLCSGQRRSGRTVMLHGSGLLSRYRRLHSVPLRGGESPRTIVMLTTGHLLLWSLEGKQEDGQRNFLAPTPSRFQSLSLVITKRKQLNVRTKPFKSSNIFFAFPTLR
jgi:hypothetical protein